MTQTQKHKKNITKKRIKQNKQNTNKNNYQGSMVGTWQKILQKTLATIKI